jgi:hypothetical protein
MPIARLLLLAAWLPLAACSKPLLCDPTGKLRVVERIVVADATTGAAAVAAKLREHGAIAAVIGLDAMSADAIAGVPADGDLAKCRRVTIGPRPAAADTMPANAARIVEENGGAAAVDLAVLWLAGAFNKSGGPEGPPPRLALGTRVHTAANAAAGGAPRPAPGDLMLAMLRTEHAGLLRVPATTGSQALGLLRAGDAAWQQQAADEVRAAAKRHPQLVVHERTAPAGGSVATANASALAALATELLDLGCRALLIATDRGDAVAAIATVATARQAAVLALDPSLKTTAATVVLGADQEVLGRAAGEQLAAMLSAGGGGGGDLLLVEAATSPNAEARTRGFAAAAGLRRP